MLTSTPTASSILRGERRPWNELSESESDSDDDGDALGKLPINQELIGVTELDQILDSVHEVISLLLRLSISVRNPAPHDRWMRYNSTDSSAFEPHDIDNVKSRFPKVSDDLAERLGRANSMRRQFFKYREEHREKLGVGLLPDDSNTVIESTVASSLRTAAKSTAFNASAIMAEDEISDGGRTQTSFATSFRGDGGKPRIPALPSGCTFDEPFERPFCFYIIAIPNRQKWK